MRHRKGVDFAEAASGAAHARRGPPPPPGKKTVLDAMIDLGEGWSICGCGHTARVDLLAIRSRSGPGVLPGQIRRALRCRGCRHKGTGYLLVKQRAPRHRPVLIARSDGKLPHRDSAEALAEWQALQAASSSIFRPGSKFPFHMGPAMAAQHAERTLAWAAARRVAGETVGEGVEEHARACLAEYADMHAPQAFTEGERERYARIRDLLEGLGGRRNCKRRI
jgi:hypothetical protein